MCENKLRVKIPATAESSRSSGQSIILRQGMEGCPRSGTMQLWRRASHYINRDGRLRFLRAKPTTLVIIIMTAKLG